MAVVVGTDTYISQTDATAYAIAHYVSTSPERLAWAALRSDDKDIMLRQACASIDQQVFAGIRATQAQSLEFPRAILVTSHAYLPVGYSWLNSDYMVQIAVPAIVGLAQVEEALALAVGVPTRIQLRRQGVTSFRLGNLSESYAGGVSGLVSAKAAIMLRAYLAGSVTIC